MQPSKLQPTGSTRLSVIIVNYQSWPDVLALVSSLEKSLTPASNLAEILIVDNASGQAIPDTLVEPRPGLHLILKPENGGFASGVNAGWHAAKGSWLLVLNPDIVAEPKLLDDILDRIKSYERRPEGAPGIVGFELRNPDGSRQPSVGAFPGLLRTIREQLIPRARRKYQPDWKVQPGPVDWVTGACFLLNRRMLESVGGMDEEFFLYHEEVALCRSAHRKNWSVEYDPSVSVIHLRPLQNRPISPKMRVITRHSKLLYFRKHLPGWQFAALNAAVRLEAKIREIWSRSRGRMNEARSWRAVDRVARELGDGHSKGGRSILELAESVEDADEPEPRRRLATTREDLRQRHGRWPRTRPLQPRKDGS